MRDLPLNFCWTADRRIKVSAPSWSNFGLQLAQCSQVYFVNYIKYLFGVFNSFSANTSQLQMQPSFILALMQSHKYVIYFRQILDS